MPEEATLDAFVPGKDANGDAADEPSEGGDEGDGTAEASGAGGATDGDATTSSVDEEPVAVTSSWLSDDAVCESCGEPAGRLWESGETRVCTACKPWTRSGETPCDR